MSDPRLIDISGEKRAAFVAIARADSEGAHDHIPHVRNMVWKIGKGQK